VKVSIITVCFNSAATIRDAIESVLAQSHADIEHIVIDGASTDETVNILGEYGENIATVISEPDGGIYDAMNKGISVATGEIVGILNSDDFFRIARFNSARGKWFLQRFARGYSIRGCGFR